MLTVGDVGVVLCSHQKLRDCELSVSSGDLVLVNFISSDLQWAWCRSSSNEEGFVPVSYIEGGTSQQQDSLSQQQDSLSTQQWVQFSPSPDPSDSELSQDYFTFRDSDPTPAPPPLSAYEDDSSPRRCYKALCRFVGSSPLDLTVSAGELVLGTDEPGQSRRWVLSYRLGGGSGYVPKNSLILANETEAKPWFLGPISRTDAENILKQGRLPMGTFLVRESQNTNGFVISYKDPKAASLDACINHRKINHANGIYTAWNGFDFPTLLALIETHLTVAGANSLHHPYDKDAGTQTSAPEPRILPMASAFVSRPLPPLPNQFLPISPPACPIGQQTSQTNPLHHTNLLAQPRPRQPPPPPPIPKRKPLILPFSRPPLAEKPRPVPSTQEQTDQVSPSVTLRTHSSRPLERSSGRGPLPVQFQPSLQTPPVSPSKDDVNSIQTCSQGTSNLELPQVPVRPLYASTMKEGWGTIREELESMHRRESRVQERANEPGQLIESMSGVESEENADEYLGGSQASSPEVQDWCLPSLTTDELPTTPPATKPVVPPRVVSVSDTKTRGKSNGGAWNIDGSQVERLEPLGSGFYGEVWKVKFTRLGKHLAMKTLNPKTMHVTDFLREAEAMKDLRHPNLVKLYGVCSDDSFTFMLIEYYPNGSVLDYLKRGGILSDKQKLEIIKNVTEGMKYLSELCYIHRDLAARNVLLADDLSARVADFGLTQLIKDDDSQRMTCLKMPWKWTAPEALCGRNQWSPLSDVWSYGVFCWELYSNCLTTPYSGIGNSRELLNFLSSGGRLERPERCNDLLYNKLMLRCWVLSTDDRISFEDIAGFLKYNELVQEG